MSHLLRTVAAYVPLTVTQQALNAAVPTPPTEPTVDVFPAAVLVADISGFTPLTEALGQKGSEGPEELTRLLNRYFSWMIAFIEAEGGEIVKFGGDALTVIFSAKDESLSLATRRAFQAATNMQTSMEEFGIMQSSVGLIHLQMSIGIGTGEVMTARVGGVNDRWEYMIIGDALRQAAQAEKQADQGQILLSPQAQAIMLAKAVPPKPLPRIDWDSVKNPEAVENVLRCFVPKSILTWLGEELHNWLATLRPMSVIFAGIIGLNYNQPGTIATLHRFVRSAQEIIYHYRGSITRITVDDKGTVMLILFGAPPYSHEDDPERALRCALDLQNLAQRQALRLSVGVTTGRVFAGPVGSNTRREYTVMADSVNLAARLMGIAAPGQIICNYDAFRSTYDQIQFEHMSPVQVKGKTEPVSIYRPLGDQQVVQQLEQMKTVNLYTKLVGRQAEIDKLEHNLNLARQNQSRIVILEGEAGIGKSQLVGQLIRLAEERGLMPLLGLGRSIDQNTPYRAWRDIFTTYFSQHNQAIEQQIQQVAPDLLDTLPLLNKLLFAQFPANGDGATDEAGADHQRLRHLFLTLLQHQAALHPLVLILENAHWLDPYSWALTVELSQYFVQHKLPLLLVLVMRPSEDSKIRAEVGTLSNLPQSQFLRLDSLLPDEILTLTAIKQGLTSNELPEAVAELLRSRAGGNPFFAEELFYYLYQAGVVTFKPMQDKNRCLVTGNLDRAAQTLPVIIQNVVLSRLDQLPPEKQLMLKIAAVIGQMFSYTALRDTLNEHLALDESTLRTYLHDLIYLGFIQPVKPEPDPAYVFKHAIVRDVTYQSLLFDRRRQLHRTVARWYENTYTPELDEFQFALESQVNPNFSLVQSSKLASTPLAPLHTLLVYHWHQAEDEEREQYYAALMGEQAVIYHANTEAVGYLNRALDLTAPDNLEERYRLLLARETAFDQLGDRERQAEDLRRLAQLAEQTENIGWKITVALHEASYAEATGKYALALDSAKLVVANARQLKDPVLETRGYLVWGKTRLKQANYAQAQEFLSDALSLAQTHNLPILEAETRYYYATIHWWQSDYTAAWQECDQARLLCLDHKSRLLEAHLLTVQGLIFYKRRQFVEARHCFEQASPIFWQEGSNRDKVMPFHNIGRIYMQEGDFDAARDYLEQALEMYRDINDEEGKAQTLTDLGILFCWVGHYATAQSYLGQALSIRREIDTLLAEADSLSKFACIYLNQEVYEYAKRYCDLALPVQYQIGAKSGQSYSLTYLAHALAGLQQFPEAIAAYEKALELRRQMEQTGCVMHIMAGVAAVYLTQNNPGQAQALAKEIAAWIEANGLAPLENPLWVCLKVYQILTSAADAPALLQQARAILTLAHNHLQQQAQGISNVKLRQTFFTVSRTNQSLLALWQQQEKS